ncbi:hypothetical protein VOLCADRAFT_121703 [Volvox carteri f. nagariensis]|uniref:Pherophorin domain-containing protein n=1 Tax=Volvox carteri f. nagariensis TaxID=3068 RepID=D8UI17_VOLCA|nr:uncharacterized protein VOLCADRAFT_121703 [Volvox carteri f. nagariensis]EFJ40595.1 hypothetical protein VOLCADRAFT_121703 [Volvox carteri f. nagariensis]|eukprot:XP_002958302.1 hypothetical protein VOLCADRAFT_121703 [Volvox carteri f. nagariensis]
MARASSGSFLLVLITVLVTLSGCLGIKFDPCQPLSEIARGDAFPLGLVLIPSINASLLANLTAANGGMCNTSFQNYLVTKFNARVAIYNMRVDRLQVLKMPFPDIIFSMVNATTPLMALAAFRANVTSAPIYIASGYTPETYGAGFMVSTALLLRFDLGMLQYLQWYDMTCNECGGIRSDLCLHCTQAGIRACATPLNSCTCNTTINTDAASNSSSSNSSSSSSSCSLADERFDVCSTSINAAWLGTDRNSAVLRTGPQVQRLNAYSITGLFNTARDKFTQLKNFAYTNVLSSWNAVSSDAQSQYVDFEGGITQYDRKSPPPPPPSPPRPPAPPPSPSPPPGPPSPPAPPAPPPAPPSPPAPPAPPPAPPSPPTPPAPPLSPTPAAAPASGRRLTQDEAGTAAAAAAAVQDAAAKEQEPEEAKL